MKRKTYLAAIAALTSAAVIGSAFAAKPAENDAVAIASAKIDLAQAVATAEQHVGGKASRAEYERHNGQWVFDVEVVKDRAVMDVKVNAGTGKVIAATADEVDHDDGADHDD